MNINVWVDLRVVMGYDSISVFSFLISLLEFAYDYRGIDRDSFFVI